MRHGRAIQYLYELGTGNLEPKTEEALLSHAEACRACREWLDTRDLLAGVFAPGSRPATEHPDTAVLALCVVRPEELEEADRADVRIHLQTCRACRNDLALARAAVLEARPRAEVLSQMPVGTLPPARKRAAMALAAGVALVLLAVALVAGGLLFSARSGPAEAELGQDPAETSRFAAMPQLTGRDLEGTQEIAGEQGLIVSKLTVQSGADVTFRGDFVAFGDGFRVEKGARIRVGSEEREGPGPLTPDERTEPSGQTP